MKDYAQTLAALREELAAYKAKRLEIVTTGQTWALKNGDDNRSLSNVSLAQLTKLINDTEAKISQLEDIVENGNRCPRGIRVGAGIL